MKINVVLTFVSLSIACAQPSLIDAARKGDADTVRHLIAGGAQVNARGQDGMTALLAAAQSNRAAVVKLLIGAGADVNARDDNGVSVLLAAAVSAGPEVVRLLLDGGAHLADGAPAQRNTSKVADVEDPYTPLLYMTVKGQLDNVRRLLAAGADPRHEINGRGLAMFASEHDWPVLVDLLDRAAHPENAASGATRDPFHRGYTRLMVAAAKGDAAEFERLLNAGGDWRSMTTSHTSMLMFAAQGGNGRILEHLVRLGAKGGGPNWAGWTAVMYAAVQGDAATVRKLLDAGEDSSIPDEDAGALVLRALTPEVREILAKVVRPQR